MLLHYKIFHGKNMEYKAYFLGEDRKIKREVSGPLARTFMNVDYTLPLSQLFDQLNIALNEWLATKPSFTLSQRFKIFRAKGIGVYCGKTQLNIGIDDKGTLDFLVVKDSLTTREKFSIVFTNDHNSPVGAVRALQANDQVLAAKIANKLNTGHCKTLINTVLSQELLDDLSNKSKLQPLTVSINQDGCFTVKSFRFDGFDAINTAIKCDLIDEKHL